MLNSSNPSTQAQGAMGLSLHGSDAREAVPQLTELLDSPNANVRQQAALALGKIGPDARSAVPSLERATRSDDWALRRQAALALGGIGEASARKSLETLQRDKNKLVQQAARDALVKLSREKKR